MSEIASVFSHNDIADRLERKWYDDELLAWAEATLAQVPGDQRALVIAGRCWSARCQLERAHDLYLRAAGLGSSLAARKAAEVRQRIELRAAVERRLLEDLDGLLADVDAAREQERDLGFQVEARWLLAELDRSTANLAALGGALRRSTEHYAASRVFAESVALDGDVATNAATFTGIAALWRALGDTEAAEQQYLAVLEARPRDPYATEGLAAVYLDRVERNGSERALVALKPLVARLPRESTALRRWWALRAAP
jgi:tetratricopeptide (TPR) repeat protein